MLPVILPELQQIINCNPVNPLSTCQPQQVVPTISSPVSLPRFTNTGDVLSALFNTFFILAFFLAFIWMFWGAFEYIFAGGDKERLSKARSRIISALIGLLLTALSFAIAQLAEQILAPQQTSPISLVPIVYAQTNFICGPPGSACPTRVDISKQYGFGNVSTLGEGLNHLATPAFSLAAVSVSVYFIIGAFNYLTAAGSKEAVEKARGMITHALVGFLILIMLFFIMQYVPQIFGFKISLF